jgi:hypothetical protein
MHRKVLDFVDSCSVPLVEESLGWDQFYGRMMVNTYLAHVSDGTHDQLWRDSRETTGKCLRVAERHHSRALRLSKLPSAHFDPWASTRNLLRPFVIESDWKIDPEDLHDIAPWGMLEE